jgi:hypothetical protein
MIRQTSNAASPIGDSLSHRRQSFFISWIAAAALSGFALTAHAQAVFPPAVFSPSTPTNLDQIQATFGVAGACFIQSSTVVVGTTVRTTVSFTGCIFGPPAPTIPNQAIFGPLPPNTYTYELYFTVNGGPPEFVSQQPLVVTQAPPPVPTIPPIGYAVLAGTLAVTAVIVLRRTVT